MTDAYTAAKLLNAAVMSTAVFPAYWLARRIVRPSFALLTAAAAVATPAMVYHAFLMSEALAYPVFLFAVAILARALAEPSGRIAVAVPAVCAVAVATRVQFLVLPLAYLAGVALCGRGAYRRHLVPAALTTLLIAMLVGIPGALGQYGEATHLGHAPAAVAHWALTTGFLCSPWRAPPSSSARQPSSGRAKHTAHSSATSSTSRHSSSSPSSPTRNGAPRDGCDTWRSRAPAGSRSRSRRCPG